MNKDELLQKELDLLRGQFRHVGIKLNTLSYSRIAYAMKQYAIAMCEEQKKECANEIDGGVFYDILGGQANFEIKEYILEAKNVAE